MHGVTRWVGALAAAGLLLAGCSGEPDEAATLPSLTTSPTPTANPSPSPSGAPTTALDPGAGDVPPEVLAAPEVYLNELAQLLSEGESPVRTRFSESCGVCEQQVARSEQLLSQGLRAEGGGWKDTTVTVEVVQGSITTLRVDTVNRAGKLVDASGSVHREYSDAPYIYIFRVMDADGRPIIVRLDYL